MFQSKMSDFDVAKRVFAKAVFSKQETVFSILSAFLERTAISMTIQFYVLLVPFYERSLSLIARIDKIYRKGRNSKQDNRLFLYPSQI
ncbi:CFC_HP_G0068260.mRNA.1.CDS.1 [Saccharomyces cerevisiae]|nr:CFC_HP_G0068260.mRNA.1.CDS.1 [Saccharomyces cerevisiae]CAI6647962.1 CFC_HP_G0068260.mRNA.1.CDS.1 [Saccharomyces cerevisiae]